MENFWKMDIVLQELKNLSESQEFFKQYEYTYGTPYANVNLDYTRLELPEIKFGNAVFQSIQTINVDSSSTNTNMTLITEDGKKYVTEFLNRGSYGKIFKTTSPKGFVFKIMRSKDVGEYCNENAFVIEAFINSVLSCDDERSKKLCPRFYGIYYEPFVFRSPVILHAKMDGILSSRTSPKIFGDMILQISDTLRYLQEKYKFIHGDLKYNNIGYKKIGINSYRFVLIDFGMSSLVYNNVDITTNVLIKRGSKMNFPNSGDLALLLASLYPIFNSMQEKLKDLLIFPGEVVSMIEKYDPDSYETYYICYGCHNPQTTPENIIEFINKNI